MKQNYLWLFLLVCLLCFPSIRCAAADAMYPTALDLLNSWQDEYPDAFCGCWCEGAPNIHLTIAVTNTAEGEALKQEILSQVEDDSTVSFVYRQYSRNELLAVQTELESYFQQDIGLVFLALRDEENQIEAAFYRPKLDLPETQAVLQAWEQQFGTAIGIQAVDYETLEPTIGTIAPAKAPPWHLIAICAVFFLTILAAALWIVQRKHHTALQTTENILTQDNASISKIALCRMIKEQVPTIPRHCDDAILSVMEENPR